jgi:hypothetical protein
MKTAPADNRKACDLTENELVNSELSKLASLAGYSSLSSMLNEHMMWGNSVAEVTDFLWTQVDVEMPKDE